MRMADITVGEDYAIRWGGDIRRGRVTFAGSGRTYRVHQDRHSYDADGPRVFFRVVRSDGSGLLDSERDVPAGNVLHPWAVEAARLDAEAAAEAMHAARLTAVRAAIIEASGDPNVNVGWEYLTYKHRYSTTSVVVDIEDLAAALRLDLPPLPPLPEVTP